MKTLKILAISVLATFAMANVSYAATDDAAQTTADNVITALTSDQGINAGTALLALYTQYKTDGKLDIENKDNVNNILKLAANINNLSKQSDNKQFLSGLISGSQNLVSELNSASVLSTLSSLSTLDLSSFAKQAATDAAESALKRGTSKLLAKMLGKASESYTVTSQSTEDANTSVSLLGDLLATFGN